VRDPPSDRQGRKRGAGARSAPRRATSISRAARIREHTVRCASFHVAMRHVRRVRGRANFGVAMRTSRALGRASFHVAMRWLL
jgi:hypothetical protein